jgi:hypothetical protein
LLFSHSLAALAIVPVGAWAGGHLEYGHWVVTSDAREAAFYAYIDKYSPKMDAWDAAAAESDTNKGTLQKHDG